MQDSFGYFYCRNAREEGELISYWKSMLRRGCWWWSQFAPTLEKGWIVHCYTVLDRLTTLCREVALNIYLVVHFTLASGYQVGGVRCQRWSVRRGTYANKYTTASVNTWPLPMTAEYLVLPFESYRLGPLNTGANSNGHLFPALWLSHQKW